MHRCVLVYIDVDTCVVKAEDKAVLDIEVLTTDEVDAVDSGVARPQKSIQSEVAQDHNIRGARRYSNAVGASHENRRYLTATTINGDGFSDGKGTKTTWIQSVNFASGGRLGDGAGEGLAWRGAAAGIGIISHAGNPGTGGLTAHKSCADCDNRKQPDRRKFSHFHL